MKLQKKTISEVLQDKLGRIPTHTELCDDVKRILKEAASEVKTRKCVDVSGKYKIMTSKLLKYGEWGFIKWAH